jgi:hypothetical protein
LPITLHLCLNTDQSPSRLQPADTHLPLYVSGEHLVLQASDRLLERLPLTLQPPVPIDLGPERPIPDLTDGLVDVVVPHVVSIKDAKELIWDKRRRDVDVDDGHGVNLTVICRAIVLRSVDRSVRLGRLGVCPECLMAEVGKKLDYNGVRTTERWINTQGESACQALKGKRKEGTLQSIPTKEDEVQGLYKVCTERMYRGCCRGSTKYTTRTE